VGQKTKTNRVCLERERISETLLLQGLQPLNSSAHVSVLSVVVSPLVGSMFPVMLPKRKPSFANVRERIIPSQSTKNLRIASADSPPLGWEDIAGRMEGYSLPRYFEILEILTLNLLTLNLSTLNLGVLNPGTLKLGILNPGTLKLGILNLGTLNLGILKLGILDIVYER
jgi:Pentapeptide repeats (8 copies)